MSVFSRMTTWATILPHEVAVDEGALSRSEVRHGLKLSIVEGMLAQVHISLTTGAFLTGFALLLGAGNTTLGIVAALPFLLQPLQLLGAWLVERQGSRKGVAVVGSFGRMFWLALILLPYLPFTLAQRLVLLVLILFCSHALLSLCVNAWTHWMTDLVPPQLRGRYFSTRNTAGAAVAMVVSYSAGLWLDWARRSDNAAHGYAMMLALGVLCAAGATVLLMYQPEPRMVRRERLSLSAIFTKPWADRDFCRFMLVGLGWQIALGIAAPFFGAHALKELKISFTTLATIDVIIAGISLITLPLWGRVADRYGHRTILIICMLGVIPLPWFWVIATPTSLFWLFINAVLSGIWWPGLGLAFSNRLMERVPTEARGVYLALFAATTGLVYFGASSLAGVTADALQGWQWQMPWGQINHYQVLFLASGVLRAVVVLGGRKAL